MMDGDVRNQVTDAEVVAAVLQGDAERYRELVERHQQRVFAVAWSRLGDATLAEEATQEAFIRGYRRLWSLRDGAKFSGWIASVARRAAINLGLRHRRELSKRQLWALEQTGEAELDSDAATPPPPTPETLRQTLGELPARHRECLVLFYLEGRSGLDTAAALGISEATLRVRLHRARAALRIRLEEKLGESLTKLRPTKALIPSVMAGVLAGASAQAATSGGAGAAILGGLAKFTPVKMVFGACLLLFTLPTLLLSWLLCREELANFREAEGFRARMFRAATRRRLAWMAVLLVVAGFLPFFLRQDIRAFCLGMAAFCLIATAGMWGQLAVNRSRYFVVMVLSCLAMAAGFALIGLGVIPTSASIFVSCAQAIPLLLVAGERPARLDYNLFLRAAEGLLESFAGPDPSDVSKTRREAKELIAFARFLGNRWLIEARRWTPDGLRLRMPAVEFSLWNTGLSFGSWGRRSELLLAWDGRVTARLSRTDQAALLRLKPQATVPAEELQQLVCVAVAGAWDHYREQNTSRAGRALGEVPESQIFQQTPAKAGLASWRTGLLVVLVTLTMLLIALKWFRPPWMDGLRPVTATEADVRAFLSGITANPNPIINHTQLSHPNDPTMALFNCMILPPTNLFSSSGLAAMREAIADGDSFAAWKSSEHRAQRIIFNPMARRAVTSGWISWSDLDLQPTDVESQIRFHQSRSPNWLGSEHLLSLRASWSWVGSQRAEVRRIDLGGLTQLRLLRDAKCLDLIDRATLIQQIAAAQTLSGTPPDQPSIHDWRDVRGLFFTPGWPALHDTYYALAALEILGGLDKIDRDACVRGILNRHSGKGYFTSPDSGGYNEYKIDGSARDTLAAFESLRILGALERVDDLAKWQFRLKTHHTSEPAADGSRTLTWAEVEAWVCQQRLQRYLKERSENPAAAARSLSEP